MAKQDFSDLMQKVKQNQATTPQQKIVPITQTKKEETLFSFYMPNETLKKLKLLSVQENKSIKSLINEAVNRAYFS